jgi:hypothetical protein
VNNNSQSNEDKLKMESSFAMNANKTGKKKKLKGKKRLKTYFRHGKPCFSPDQ